MQAHLNLQYDSNALKVHPSHFRSRISPRILQSSHLLYAKMLKYRLLHNLERPRANSKRYKRYKY